MLLFTASDLASITSHIQSCVLFLLSLHLFILSGVVAPLFSSSIVDTYQPGEFIFQCPIFLPFHTVHGILKVRTGKGVCQGCILSPCLFNICRVHHEKRWTEVQAGIKMLGEISITSDMQMILLLWQKVKKN